jgi:hypothetical protein
MAQHESKDGWGIDETLGALLVICNGVSDEGNAFLGLKR